MSVNDRSLLTASKRWVVKIGTSLLTHSARGLNPDVIDSLASQIAELKSHGVNLVLVSSGSIGEGMHRLGWNRRPGEVHRLQTAAAVGQIGLLQAYESAFAARRILAAQILLTHADLANRERYLNARNTLRELLSLGVVPIVNENDAVVNDQIKFGDNDTLAALTANLIEAECLILLTDQPGLLADDPKKVAVSRLIEVAQASDASLLSIAGDAGQQGQGGMKTKLKAAQTAAGSGASTVIASGLEEQVLIRLRAGETLGTLLLPGRERLAARKQWLAGQLRGNGQLAIDQGAVQVLVRGGKSLLPIGVTAVQGSFTRGEIVICVDPCGGEVARGLINYSSEEVKKILGMPSDQIEKVLGYRGESELIHRDNIAITA